MKIFFLSCARSFALQKLTSVLEVLTMIRDGVFVFLVCYALAGYAVGQGSEFDQCEDYQQAISAYYTCIIKCYQFVLGFNDSTADFCTGKFRLTKASRNSYNNGDMVNTLKCISIKCKQFVPDDACEDSSSGFEDDSHDGADDISPALSTKLYEEGSILEASTSALPEATEGDTKLSTPKLPPGSIETAPPSVIDAETRPPPQSADNSIVPSTQSPQMEDLSKILQSIEELPSDAEECDEDEDEANDDGINSGSFPEAVAPAASDSEVALSNSNPYFDDESCVSDAYPFDDGSANDGSVDNGGDSSSASAASAGSNGDDSSASAASAGSNGDDSSAIIASSSSGSDSSSASASSSSSSSEGSSASDSSSNSSSEGSSASAASASSGEGDSSASASASANSSEDSSASADGDFDASTTNQTISSLIELSQNISQPYVAPASEDTPGGSSFESPAGISNDGLTPNDQISDTSFDVGNRNNDYAGSEGGAVQDGSRSYHPQVIQNQNWIPNSQKVSDNTQQGSLIGPQRRPAFNPQQRLPYNYQQRPVFNQQPLPQNNPQQGSTYNSQQGQVLNSQGLVYNPQQGSTYNLQQGQVLNSQGLVNNPQQGQVFNSQQGTLYNTQQGRVYNPQQVRVYNRQQGRVFNPQEGRVYNPQQEVYNSQQGQVYNPQQGEVHNSQGQVYNLQQGQVYNSQQGSKYNSVQGPINNNFANNENYSQQQNQWQRNPTQNNWNGNKNNALPFNNQGNQRYRGNQGNVNYNGRQGNADNALASNNGGIRGIPPNFVNN